MLALAGGPRNKSGTQKPPHAGDTGAGPGSTHMGSPEAGSPEEQEGTQEARCQPRSGSSALKGAGELGPRSAEAGLGPRCGQGLPGS